MRCPDCNRFVSLDLEPPELEDSGLGDGRVWAKVRIIRSCAECGQELKEGTIDPEDEPTDLIDLTDGVDGVEIEFDDPEQLEEGGGRYKKSFFGATIPYRVTRGGEEIYAGELTEKMAASEMEELV